MSTKPLIINKSSWQYKLYSTWSVGSPPQKAWHYYCGVALMSAAYVALAFVLLANVVCAVMFALTAISPIYLHFWPGNGFFSLLHERLWSDVATSLILCAVLLLVILLCYWQADRFRQLGRWISGHKPAPRSIRVVD